VIGTAPRAEVRRQKLLHRGIAVLCYNSSGEIYVHRRTATKDVFPSMYDMFISGMVSEGESYRDCAVRELAEEVGVAGPEPELLFKHLYLKRDNPSWVALFRVVWDGPIEPQAAEIESGSFLSPAELDSRLSDWPFVPDGLDAYSAYQRWLRSSHSSG
jgi:8-oxo-dGTP pyrophosphatase MutT (NUDIX family)